MANLLANLAPFRGHPRCSRQCRHACSHDPTGASWAPSWPVCSCSRCASTPRANWASATRGALRELRAATRRPVYLDHPGLIGVLRALRRGRGSDPFRRASVDRAARHPDAVGRGASPLELRGASWAGAVRRISLAVVTPEIAVGLFGMTPDLPLILCDRGALASLRSPFAAARLPFSRCGARVRHVHRLACDAKVSGGSCSCGIAGASSRRRPTPPPHARSLRSAAARADGGRAALRRRGRARVSRCCGIASWTPRTGAGPSLRNLERLCWVASFSTSRPPRSTAPSGCP